MLKKAFISTLLIVVCCLSAGTNVGLAVPVSSLGDWNEGDPGTTHQFWDFTPANVVYGVGYTAIPESVISPDAGAVVATISPGGSYNSDTDSFVAKNYLLVSLEIPNYDVLNPYKVIWVDIGNAVINPDDIAVSAVGNGIPSTAYVCQLLPGQGDAEFGVQIWPNPEIEKLTMFFGPGTVLDYVHVDTICVPEPATIVLLGSAGLCVFTRRKKSLGAYKSK